MSLVVLVYDRGSRSRSRVAQVLGDLARETAPTCTWLTLYVADQAADIPSPSPFPLWGPRPVAFLDIGTPSAHALASKLTHVLEQEQFQAHAYGSERSIPKDYGDTPHGPARDWPDGSPSPGPVTLNLLRRPASLDVDSWVHRWHTVMGPVSGQIQPRTRYVRHLLTGPLTAGAPPWDGIAMESWPSIAHLRSPKRFYGAHTVPDLIRNQLAILRAVSHCFWVWQIHTQPMTEIFVRTPPPSRP